MKLLMVEDDVNTVKSFKLCLEIYLPDLILEATGFGQKALDMLGQGGYDCMLLDLGLPDVDGTELIKQVRAFSTVPIVVLSARNSQEIISQALDLGANGYITKPYETWNLLKTLYQYANKNSPSVKN